MECLEADVCTPGGAGAESVDQKRGQRHSRCIYGLTVCRQRMKGPSWTADPFTEVSLPFGHPVKLERWLRQLGFLKDRGAGI